MIPSSCKERRCWIFRRISSTFTRDSIRDHRHYIVGGGEVKWPYGPRQQAEAQFGTPWAGWMDDPALTS